jgi:hypothetical protein
MEVLAEGLDHEQARSIEGALIRKRVDEKLTLKDRMTLSIEVLLEKAELLNKNRGRVKERWTSNNPLDEHKDKMNKSQKKANCH